MAVFTGLVELERIAKVDTSTGWDSHLSQVGTESLGVWGLLQLAQFIRLRLTGSMKNCVGRFNANSVARFYWSGIAIAHGKAHRTA